MNKRNAGLLSFILFTLIAILHFVHFEGWIVIPATVLMISRWVFIASLIVFALYKKSLTTWILVAMAIGIGIGLDFACPDAAALIVLSVEDDLVWAPKGGVAASVEAG